MSFDVYANARRNLLPIDIEGPRGQTTSGKPYNFHSHGLLALTSVPFVVNYRLLRILRYRMGAATIRQ